MFPAKQEKSKANAETHNPVKEKEENHDPLSKIPFFTRPKQEIEEKKDLSKENEDLKEYLKKYEEELLDAESEVIYESIALKDAITIVLSNRGVFFQKLVKGFLIVENIYSYKNFEITGRYTLNDENEEVNEFFTFILNNITYNMKTFVEMKQILKEQAYHNRTGSSYITVVLRRYADQFPAQKIREACGFLEEGWVLPPEQFNTRDHLANKDIKRIHEMLELEPDETKARIYLKQLYNMITIDHKDIFFAYFLSAPFYHALKKNFKIMPVMVISGEKGTGKSIISEVSTEKAYNLEYSSDDLISTPSRFMSYFSATTFPKAVDELEVNKDDKIRGTIKSHAVMNVPFIRKNSRQETIINTVLHSPIIMNFNYKLPFLRERAMKDRILDIELKNKAIGYNGWERDYNKIENGVIGRWLIEATKSWNLKKILDIIYDENNTIVDYSITDSRQRGILALLMFGAYISEKIFGLILDTTEFKGLVKTSIIKDKKEFITIVKEMAIFGCNRDSYSQFKPIDWVKSPTFTIFSKKVDKFGILLLSSHKDMILRKIDPGRRNRMSMSNFCEYLRDYFPDTHMGVFKIKIDGKMKSARGIFLPVLDIFGVDTDLYEIDFDNVFDDLDEQDDSELEEEMNSIN